ncbi:MAG: mandelate racemase/muconate lactonizing enzyme family protein [Bacteroidetes bacterium]|nr:mandelate racemase/muconate lactonizing enzyme family protein [Bacteroidota bacterium]MCL5026853.1 mandelate racemase/muconate lactonizing enzyme family protein [Chloroflexota bacterium]
MKITDIQATTIRGHQSAETFYDWVLVKVYTDEGVSGLGEAYHGPGVEEIILSDRFRRLLIGEDPRNVDRLFEKMRRGTSGAGSSAGAVVAAISGVEIALWDLVGRAVGVPVYQLLGGKFRDRIRVYADFRGGKEYTPESYAERAKEVVADGFDAVKIDIDVPIPVPSADAFNKSLTNAEIRYMVELVRATREAIGPDIDLAVDTHYKWYPDTFLKLAWACEEFKLLWLEDPVPPEDIPSHRWVTHSTRTPICTGECLYLRHGFRPMLEVEGANIISPDIPKMGGLLEFRKVADMCDTWSIPMAPHNAASALGTVASLHACAAIPNFLILEYHYHATDVKWYNDLVDGPGKPVVDKSYIRVPDAPGLGVDLNEDVVRAHLLPGKKMLD